MRRKGKDKKNSSGWPVVDPTTSEIPPFLANAIDYLGKHLDVEGIFRISALQSDVEKLTKLWKKGKVAILGDEHTVAGSLKLFFRAFDDPLLTYELYDAFLEAANQKLAERKYTYVVQAIHLLPPYNRALLKALLELLHLVSTRSSVNKMSPANLAIVFAPSIIRAENETQMEAMMSMRVTTDLVEYLIQDCAKIFAPPAKAAPAASPPVEEERFQRELRRGTIRLGTRLMISKLETMEEEEEVPPEVPSLPDELVADVLQEQSRTSQSQPPSLTTVPELGRTSQPSLPAATPAAAVVPPVATEKPALAVAADNKKIPAGAVKMLAVGEAPVKTVAVKSQAAGKDLQFFFFLLL